MVSGIDEGFGQLTLTRLQRWSHYLTLLVCTMGFIYGLNMRQSILGATIPYSNIQAGIDVRYPANWLIDENGQDYIFRVRDMTRLGYKTTLQIDVRPVGPTSSAEVILNSLALQRSTRLSQYRTLLLSSGRQLNERESVEMTYSFTTTEADATLESLPNVVLGRDVLVILRGQAVIISFRADARTFDNDLAVFDRFLNSLEFQ